MKDLIAFSPRRAACAACLGCSDYLCLDLAGRRERSSRICEVKNTNLLQRVKKAIYFIFAGGLAPSRINFLRDAGSKSLRRLNRTHDLPMLALGRAFL